MTPLPGFPRSVPIIFWLLSLAYVGGTRFGVRSYFNWLAQRFRAKAPVVIYGAGKSGVELARTLQQQGDRVPVAFLDDDPLLQRRTINGVYVYAPRVVAGAAERYAGARSARRGAVRLPRPTANASSSFWSRSRYTSD